MRMEGIAHVSVNNQSCPLLCLNEDSQDNDRLIQKKSLTTNEHFGQNPRESKEMYVIDDDNSDNYYENSEDSLSSNSDAIVVEEEEIDECYIDEEDIFRRSKELSPCNSQECGICLDYFPVEKMFAPIFCTHKFCLSCAAQHYKMQIKNFGIENVVCPFPSCTDIQKMDGKQQQEYFSFTKSQLLEILDQEIIDIFERKLLDWNLSSDKDFVWCPKCVNGMIAANSGEEFITCNNCSCRICPQCKIEWTTHHAERTCEEFKTWNDLNDPTKQTKQLNQYLEKNGIECPECNMKFIKPSGGCLHLTCPVCRHQFCEGCFEAFKTGQDCGKSDTCATQGFHAHHPRNCFYFLRDWEPVRLQGLLTRHNVTYKSEFLTQLQGCSFIEQKETQSGFKDEACARPIEPMHAGYCRKHYVRYLAQLVLKHNIDPVYAYDLGELQMCLQKIKGKLSNENNKDRDALIEQILQLGGLSLTSTFSSSGFEEDENSEENGKLSEAAALPPPTGWNCAFCTYYNPEENSVICAICSRTRTLYDEEFEIWEDGVECTNCTLINLVNSQVCEACGKVLQNNGNMIEIPEEPV